MNDVTIKDELDGNDEVSSESEKARNLLKWSYI